MSNPSYILENIKHFIDKYGDPRVQDWLFMGSPVPLITILVSYLYFCTSAGPRYMKDRKPYNLKEMLIAYNGVQVVASMYLVYEGLVAGWYRDYSLTCQPVDYSQNPKSLRMASAVWMYFFFKLTELLDTVFFVMRKKMNQVSFLHLYHHTMMPVCGWIGVKFLAGGHGTLLGVINSFIHVIMYAYYLVAGLGPQYQKYLWWKKYLTVMQMIQFLIIFFHSSQVIFTDCDYPKVISILLTTQALVFLYLFGSFYFRTYHRRAPANAVKSNGVANGKPTTNGSIANGKPMTNGSIANGKHVDTPIENGKLKDEKVE